VRERVYVLREGNPAVGTRCSLCGGPFVLGDTAMLLPKPGALPDGGNVEAVLAHASCVKNAGLSSLRNLIEVGLKAGVVRNIRTAVAQAERGHKEVSGEAGDSLSEASVRLLKLLLFFRTEIEGVPMPREWEAASRV
jgi:hypothetical protein